MKLKEEDIKKLKRKIRRAEALENNTLHSTVKKNSKKFCRNSEKKRWQREMKNEAHY